MSTRTYDEIVAELDAIRGAKSIYPAAFLKRHGLREGDGVPSWVAAAKFVASEVSDAMPTETAECDAPKYQRGQAVVGQNDEKTEGMCTNTRKPKNRTREPQSEEMDA